MSTKPLI